jgi:hypothetical protein
MNIGHLYDIFDQAESDLVMLALRIREELGGIVRVRVGDGGLHGRLGLQIALHGTGAPDITHARRRDDNSLWIFARSSWRNDGETEFFTQPALGYFDSWNDVLAAIKHARKTSVIGQPLISSQYAMFSEDGNDVVRKAITDALIRGKRTKVAAITQVAKDAGFSEASDTAVREMIWTELQRLDIADYNDD